MAAKCYNITIEQGADFQLELVYQDDNGDPIDLTGYTAEMQIREKLTTDPPFLTLSTANGRIVIDGPNGSITLSIANADTAALTQTAGVYDLELTSGDATPVIVRLIEGQVKISQEVTR